MKDNFKKSFFLFIVYLLLIVIYRYIVAIYFDYLGFQIEYYSLSKLFFASIIVILLILLGIFIRNNFYSLIYNIALSLFLFGQSIFYIFNDSNFILVIYMAIPIIFIFVVEKLDSNKRGKFKGIKVDLKDLYTYIFLIFLTVVLVLPYFKNLNIINWKNLFFIDVYDTRQLEDTGSNFLMGYIFSPVARVLLPFLFVYSVNNKARILTIFSIFSIVMMFLLNGALKSILLGFLAALFFLKGNYEKKNSRYLYVLFIISSIAVFQYLAKGSYFLSDYIRRIFFTPARLFQVYYDYFNDNFTFFKHSRISKMLGINEYEVFIPHFIGRNVMGREGLSANVGIFTEGFLSFGTIGVIFISAIFALIIYIIKQLNFKPSYFGIVFSFLYVINTSFIETLFITHGLLFFLVFGYFFIPSNKNRRIEVD